MELRCDGHSVALQSWALARALFSETLRRGWHSHPPRNGDPANEVQCLLHGETCCDPRTFFLQ